MHARVMWPMLREIGAVSAAGGGASGEGGEGEGGENEAMGITSEEGTGIEGGASVVAEVAVAAEDTTPVGMNLILT